MKLANRVLELIEMGGGGGGGHGGGGATMGHGTGRLGGTSSGHPHVHSPGAIAIWGGGWTYPPCPKGYHLEGNVCVKDKE